MELLFCLWANASLSYYNFIVNLHIFYEKSPPPLAPCYASSQLFQLFFFFWVFFFFFFFRQGRSSTLILEQACQVPKNKKKFRGNFICTSLDLQIKFRRDDIFMIVSSNLRILSMNIKKNLHLFKSSFISFNNNLSFFSIKVLHVLLDLFLGISKFIAL